MAVTTTSPRQRADPSDLAGLGRALALSESAWQVFVALWEHPDEETWQVCTRAGTTELGPACDELLDAGLLRPGARRWAVGDPPGVLAAFASRRQTALDRRLSLLHAVAGSLPSLPRADAAQLVHHRGCGLELYEQAQDAGQRIVELAVQARHGWRMQGQPTQLPDGLPAAARLLLRGPLWDRPMLAPQPQPPPPPAGTAVRILPTLPLQAAGWAETAVVLPVPSGRTPGASLICTRAPVILAAQQLFQRCWDRAQTCADESWLLPFAAARIDLRIPVLLLQGTTDAAIATQLGISSRTLGRQMAALLCLLGARTRFQAGVELARRRNQLP
jgi:hypothetical protein